MPGIQDVLQKILMTTGGSPEAGRSMFGFANAMDALKSGGQNVPPVASGQDPSSIGNIAGRAAVGIGKDLGAVRAREQEIFAPSLEQRINPFLESPDVREFLGATTGKDPGAFLPVNLDKQRESEQQGIAIEETPTVPPQPEEGDVGKKKSKFLALAARLGIPLGAAIAGSVNPGLLPQAAGLATGFEEGVKESQERSAEALKQQSATDMAKLEIQVSLAELDEKIRNNKQLSGADLKNAIEAIKKGKGFFGKGKVIDQLIARFQTQFDEAGASANFSTATGDDGKKIVSFDGKKTWFDEQGQEVKL